MPAPMRILVIDDDPHVRNAIARSLREHTVVLCDGGAGALDLVADDAAFDAVLCDMTMPPMDGPTFYERLVEVRPELCTRLVFTTGDAESRRAFLERTGRPTIEKPFTRADLLAAIAALEPTSGFHTLDPNGRIKSA